MRFSILGLVSALIAFCFPEPLPVYAGPGAACSGKLVIATWYSTGRLTASGERFDPNSLTVAHRTLPFGSRILVTNPRNGKSVTVVVNDRGPFTRGVTLDLARGAARTIGMNPRQSVCMTEISL